MTAAAGIAVLWIGFIVYWLVAAIGVKKPIRRTAWWQRYLTRAVIIAAVVLSLRAARFRQALERMATGQHSPEVQAAGLALCACGLAFAVWARLHLGRNWGQPMTLKEGHELVTTGPYRYVRHPIYTGILAGSAGSWLVIGTPWLLALAVTGVYFVISARTEEKIMAERFPQQYPEYKKRTKGLVPFMW